MDPLPIQASNPREVTYNQQDHKITIPRKNDTSIDIAAKKSLNGLERFFNFIATKVFKNRVWKKIEIKDVATNSKQTLYIKVSNLAKTLGISKKVTTQVLTQSIASGISGEILLETLFYAKADLNDPNIGKANKFTKIQEKAQELQAAKISRDLKFEVNVDEIKILADKNAKDFSPEELVALERDVEKQINYLSFKLTKDRFSQFKSRAIELGNDSPEAEVLASKDPVLQDLRALLNDLRALEQKIVEKLGSKRDRLSTKLISSDSFKSEFQEMIKQATHDLEQANLPAHFQNFYEDLMALCLTYVKAKAGNVEVDEMQLAIEAGLTAWKKTDSEGFKQIHQQIVNLHELGIDEEQHGREKGMLDMLFAISMYVDEKNII